MAERYKQDINKLQLLDYTEGEDAWDFIYKDNEYNTKPSSTQHWILFKFHLDYISGTNTTDLFSADDLIDSDTFHKPTKSSLKVYDYVDFDNVNDSYDIELYPGTGDDFYYAILVDKEISHPMIHVNEYDTYYDDTTDSFKDRSIWFSTDPNYTQPQIIKKAATKKVTVIVYPSKMGTPTATTPKRKTIKLAIKKQQTVTGYQYQYATNSSFRSAKYTKTSTASQTTKTIYRLVSGRTYYVRVRAYKVVNGKTYYGAWSGVRKVRVR